MRKTYISKLKMTRQNYTIIEDFVKSYIPSLSKFCIYDTDDGRYIMFERYSVQKFSDKTVVNRYRDDRVLSFNRMRNAVAWVVLDKNNKMWEANRLLELDLRIVGLEIDLAQHERIKKTTNDMERYDIMINKIQHNRALQNKFQKEIDKYIIMANDCQQQGFKNELTRSSRKQKEPLS